MASTFRELQDEQELQERLRLLTGAGMTGLQEPDSGAALVAPLQEVSPLEKSRQAVRAAYTPPGQTPEEQALEADLIQTQAGKYITQKQRDARIQDRGRGLLGMAGGLYRKRRDKKLYDSQVVSEIGSQTALAKSKRAAAMKAAIRAGEIEIATGDYDGQLALAKQNDQQDFVGQKGSSKTMYNSKNGSPMTFVEGYDGKLTGPNGESAEGFQPDVPAKALEANRGREKVTKLIGELGGTYVDLFMKGGGVGEGQTGGQNLVNFARNSFSSVEKAFGGEVATIRSKIDAIKPILISEFRRAAELGVKGMDTQREIDFYMSALGDQNSTLESNLAAMSRFQDVYGADILSEDSPMYKLLQSPQIEAEKTRLRQQFVDKRDARYEKFDKISQPIYVTQQVWDSKSPAQQRRAKQNGYARMLD
tara:strand:+ start:104 stop:1363 length:1260 start_codon:yes stop_codon:yes gene_type:complete